MNFYSDNYQVGCQFVTFRKYFHRTRLWPEMHSLRLSRGVLFTAIGWFLSADAILGAFAFLMVRMSVGEFGGRYPPDLIFFLIWPLLLAGVFVSYHGSLLLHKRIVLAFPLAGIVVMFYMFQYMTCVPWMQCFAP